MGYTKKWVPSTIPLRDNLPAWKTICLDIHSNLIDAGLIQTADTGQLDIDGVSVLPADGTFEGYRIYRFDDDLQAVAPIFIKIEFGCGIEGLYSAGSAFHRNRTLRIRVTVGTSTNGAGVMDGHNTTVFECPQNFNNSSGLYGTQLTQPGWSAICHNKERGFLGFVYGIGSRNEPLPAPQGSYVGSSLTLIIQRTQTHAGVPTEDGFLVLYPNLTANGSNNWATDLLPRSQTQYISYTDGPSTPSSRFNSRIDQNVYPYVDGKPWLQPMWAIGKDRLLSFSCIAQYILYTIGDQTELDIETIPGTTSNFIALGNRNSLSLSEDMGQFSAIAMLFE